MRSNIPACPVLSLHLPFKPVMMHDIVLSESAGNNPYEYVFFFFVRRMPAHSEVITYVYRVFYIVLSRTCAFEGPFVCHGNNLAHFDGSWSL